VGTFLLVATSSTDYFSDEVLVNIKGARRVSYQCMQGVPVPQIQ